MSVDRNDIVKFGDVKEPIVIDQLIVKIQREIILIALNWLA